MSPKARILIVDDELIIRESLLGWLKKSGHELRAAEGGQTALKMMEEAYFDLVFLDVMMPDVGGLDILKTIRARYPDVMVVMITAFGSVENAVQAMKLGANDYLMKPFDPELLSVLVDKLLNQKRLIEENLSLREQVKGLAGFDNLIGVSENMLKLFELIEKIAIVDSAVLIRGETGTGKELIARAIHARSSRSGGSFVAINCGAFPESLLESELFGHEAGAFTGAARTGKKGRLELAQDGTLFLDEIGEIPAKMQVDLLRVLQEKRFQRVGSSKDILVNFRLISATHRNLHEEIKRGTFRQDLYFRLNVIEIEVPPLRERADDIPVLAQHFLDRFRKETNKPVTTIQKQALELLESHNWPGNIRELENAIERAVVLVKGSQLTRSDFAFLFRSPGQTTPYSLEEMERTHIDQILKYCQWNISKAAKILQVNRTTLHNKIKKYALKTPEFQQPDFELRNEPG
ncbi:MAG: sigma-54-dependent transcriptional regulator [Syntrophobacteraceae bacterium]